MGFFNRRKSGPARTKKMLRYFPIDAGISFRCSASTLIGIDWGINHLSADFLLPDDETHALRVYFDRSTIVRLLDEMPLSTETDFENCEGLVNEHFAYRVEGAVFAETQSETWKELEGHVTHYQFITGWGCMDVLSSAHPSFEVVKREPEREAS